MSANVTGTLLPQQRRLWNFLCWYFPDHIRQVLESRHHVHSTELHALYWILTESKGKTPGCLLYLMQGVPEPAAEEMLAALEDLHVDIAACTNPDPQHAPTDARGENRPSARAVAAAREHVGGWKPLFHSAEREELWLAVNALFDGGFLGRSSDGSAQEVVGDFLTLNLLLRLDFEDRRAAGCEDIRLCRPDHWLYHTTDDREVEQMLQKIRAPLFPQHASGMQTRSRRRIWPGGRMWRKLAIRRGWATQFGRKDNTTTS